MQATAVSRPSRLMPALLPPGTSIGGVFAVALFMMIVTISAAPGHFMLSSNIRVIHIEHVDHGLRVYMRLPMPIAVADLVGARRADGTTEAAPYTTNQIEGGQLMHYLDVAALRHDPLGLGDIIAGRHALVADGRLINPRVEAVRVYPAIEQTRFTTLEEARLSLEGPAYLSQVKTIYAGETVVDVRLFYAAGSPVRAYAFGARVTPALPGLENLANLLVDHAADASRAFRSVGSLEHPIVVGDATLALTPPTAGLRSWAKAIRTFLWQGIMHILNGTDHVLFVLCMTIGALGLGNLLWRVTGFTLGHTVTLTTGFFGLAPAVPWFIPLIETAIAVSIVYAGSLALLRRVGGASFFVTATIGLLHGFGFSFVLHRILQVDAPALWPSLLSFNLGVEIGQLGIILLIWPALQLAERRVPHYAAYGRVAIVLPAIAIAVSWTVERFDSVWQRVVP
jgi:hypothetical protein